MAKINDTNGAPSVGNGRLYSFRDWMQTFSGMQLDETPIGNLPATTFRPTEAEKLVLLNVDDMTQQGRSVTQQDAINVPDDKLEKDELNKDKLEAAFKQLITVNLLAVEPNQTVVITQQGVPIVDELRKAEQQEAENEPSPQEMPMDMGTGDMNMPPAGPTGAMPMGGAPMEGISLIRDLNELSKLL